MATVACPECGLPRVESELGAKPCPVCAAPPSTAVPRAKPKPEADPTDGMAADASQLYSPAPTRASAGGSRLGFGAVAFVLGALFGIGGVLGVQAIDWSKPKLDEHEVAAKPADDTPAPTSSPVAAAQPAAPREGQPASPAPVTPGAPKQPGTAPMPPMPPPEPKAVVGELIPDPELGPDVKQIKPPQPGHVETHEFNEPKDTYSVPALKKGEHVVLKGKVKVKALRIHGLDAGAVLDASELEAGVITITGKIDGGAKLKLNAPSGTVHVSGKIDGKAAVEINAPGGEVKFMLATVGTREGSKIDGGSTVAITARVVEFKGDITGADTKVSVTLTKSAWLKVASVSGKAVVEYKSQMAGWSPPDVVVGPVAPTAVFRVIE